MAVLYNVNHDVIGLWEHNCYLHTYGGTYVMPWPERDGWVFIGEFL